MLLNVEEEHLDHYPDLAAIETVFRQLLDQTHGKIFYCIDDVNTVRLCEDRATGISFGSSCRAGLPLRNTAVRASSNHGSRFTGAASVWARSPSTSRDGIT